MSQVDRYGVLKLTFKRSHSKLAPFDPPKDNPNTFMFTIEIASGHHDMSCRHLVIYHHWRVPVNQPSLGKINGELTTCGAHEAFKIVSQLHEQAPKPSSYLAIYTPGRIVHATCDTRVQLAP
jgi:hypothetical protein